MYEAIARNRRRSILLLAALALLLGACGFAIFEAWLSRSGFVGLGVGCAVALAAGLWAWFGGSWAVLASAEAEPVAHEDMPRLYNVVEEMALAAGLPMPKVYVVDDPAPNAFATGRGPGDAAIAVTQGLIARLSREELQGVIAHEMGHIRNRDILFMTLATVLVGAVDTLAEWSGRASRSSVRHRSRVGGAASLLVAVAAGLAVTVAPIVARLVYLAVSREREYLADATAAFLTRYPSGLADALEKIASSPVRMDAREGTAALCIVNPRQPVEGEDMFSTHPSTRRRVSILRAIGGEGGFAEYEAAFRRLTGRSVVPPSARSAEPTTIKLGRDPGWAAPADQSERVGEYRRARDAARSRADYRVVSCACGTRLRIPPGLDRPAVRCPRCRAIVAVDRPAVATLA